MKQKLLALLTAVLVSISLVGCNTSTPDTVGYIGEVEITSGIYLISQFQAYQTVLGYANTEQSSMTVSNFLKETVYLAQDGTAAPEPEEGEEQTGEAQLVSAFVASETLSNLQYYAAIETMFAELGGVLSEEELATAESYAEQLWAYYGDLYAANGIGESTLLAYQYTSMKQSALLDLLYGTDGTEAVSDAELTTYLEEDLVFGSYISVPLYNTSDYTFADSDQQNEIVAALTLAVEVFDSMMAEDDAQALPCFATALSENITTAYEVMGSEFDASTLSDSIVSDLYSYDTLAEYFDEDTLATVTALDVGQATVFVSDYTSAMVFLRSDAFEAGYTLDDLRETILLEMKSDILVSLVEETGAALSNHLDENAMEKFPTKKIVAE